MERTEPALIPEWLRSTGNVTGGGASAHHSDVSSVYSTQSRSFKGNSEKDSPRFLDRNSSFHSKRSSSSNGSTKHPYSSFTRSNRDKNRDREKEKSLPVDIWDNDSFQPLSSISTSRVENSALRRTHSLVSRKPGEVLPHRVEDSKNSVNSQHCANGVLYGGSNPNGIQKATFEKDFPSLGTEEKQGLTGIRRVLSPGLGSAVQNLPIGNSGFRGGEKWTSALAEVPSILANNGIDHSPLQQSVGTFSTSASGSSNLTGLNMAEALTLPPARVRATTTQLPDKSQRLEELAIKQSRQLIPMTPSMPKPLIPGSTDKSKQPKVALRTNEMSVTSKAVQLQPHSSHLSNQSRVGQVRSDSSGTSHVGKYMVLKSGRESGFPIGAKDASSPCGDANCRVTNGQLAVSPSTTTASINLNNSTVFALENKAAALSLSSRSTVDKRPSQSLAKSRSEFFNLMRRKTLPNATATLTDTSLPAVPSSAETSGEILKEAHALMNTRVFENDSQINCNVDGHDIPEIINFSDFGEKNMSGNGGIHPDEEEAAFLRSLGWEENGGEDEGLTEEEINAFYLQYMNRRPSLQACRRSQLKCSTPSEFHTAISGLASSDSSSKSESEA